MNPDRWQLLNDIFHTATSLDPVERAVYLDDACGGDPDLRREAERLVAAHERAGRFIETPAMEISSLWPAPAAGTIAAGRRFGPYRVVHEIARGGMGAVYLAERADGQYEQRVALKVIRRGLDIEPMLRRFRAERQILASLEHPNIARLLDGGTGEDGEPFFAMEYIDGEPIDQYVRSRALTISERLRLFLPVCDAVAYAHRLGVVHRDIKPANILVTANGVPKLLDFGIAKTSASHIHGATSSVTGLRLLTPEYASPEQVEGQTATIQSDIYSLGVVLYELLTGVSPYQPRSRDPLAVADAVRTTIPERPSATTSPLVRRQLRGDLDTIVLAALRKEPARRYPSVDEIAADIRHHLDGLPINARRDSVPYRAGKFLRRNRAAVLAAGGAVLATSLVSAAVVLLGDTSSEMSLLQAGAIATRDRIVVSRFTDQRGDTLLGAALTDAFRTDLAQSPHVRVLSPVQVRGALERLQYDGSFIPSDSVARELAVREGAKAYVSGTLAQVGGTYAITVQLIAAENGEALAAVHETAADSTQLIAAVGRASRTIRQRLGETLRDLRDMPGLEKATTASLPALRSYSEGYSAFLAGDRQRAIRLYEEAVALDSAFATAYSAMAAAYSAMNERGREHAARLRVLAHLDRLPHRERGRTVASYAYGRNDLATAIREYERLLERYPTDVPLLNNLALAHRDARNFAAAESLWHRAIAIDSAIPTLYYGLHNALLPQGRTADGRHILDVLQRRFPADELLPIVRVQQAAAEQAWDEAERLAFISLEQNQRNTYNLVDAYEQLAGIAMTQGRLREAEQRWRMQLDASTRSQSYGRRLFGAQQLAYLELRYRRQPQRARAVVDSVLALLPLDDILPGDRPYEGLARFYARVGDIQKAKALLAAADGNNRTIDVQRPAENAWTRGVIALAEGRVGAAEAALREAALEHSCPICVLPDLARAYDAAGKHQLALDTYRSYLTTPWLWRYETDATDLGHALKRVGELHEMQGDRAAAVAAFTRLIRLWERADSALAEERGAVMRKAAQLARQ